MYLYFVFLQKKTAQAENIQKSKKKFLVPVLTFKKTNVMECKHLKLQKSQSKDSEHPVQTESVKKEIYHLDPVIG